jgi:phage tail-like protein
MGTDRVIDPYAAFLFAVRVGATQAGSVGGFSEIGGLAFESEIETMRAGGQNNADLQLVGPSKYPTRLVLKRGLADASFFWNWYMGVMQGKVVRKALTVMLRDESGGTPYSWTFSDACPVKWTGPSLQAASSAVAFEAIEFVHRGLDLSAAVPTPGQG